MTAAPYLLQAGPNCADAGKFFRIRQQYELHATWHANPHRASLFANKVEAERHRRILFPNIWHEIHIISAEQAVAQYLADAHAVAAREAA